MALPSKYGIDKKINSMEGLSAYENGGKGSGNFGHSGRPGEVGGSGGEKTQLQRAAEAEATAGKVGYFAGLQYVDEIYKEKSGKMKDDLSRLKEVKDRDGYVDANDPAHNRLDEIKGQLARAKELVGSDVQDAQRAKIEKLEKLVDDIENITGWKNSTDRTETLLNGGKGSGNWGHAGRPGEIGGSASGGSSGNIRVHEGSKEMGYYYAEDGDRVLASGKTPEEALAKAKEAVKKMGEELRKKSPVRKQDEWFTTLKQIDDEYEKRGKEMEDNAGEVESAIYETGETWTGPKQKALDLVKIGIRTNRDMFTDRDEFLEQTQGLFDDLRDVEGFKAKTVDVYEHPMSASGIVIQEHKKK